VYDKRQMFMQSKSSSSSMEADGAHVQQFHTLRVGNDRQRCRPKGESRCSATAAAQLSNQTHVLLNSLRSDWRSSQGLQTADGWAACSSSVAVVAYVTR
jgi:hypothetical protein